MTRPVELGPWLGRLVSPPEPVTAAEALLSELRLELLTGVFEKAGWSAIWERAVSRAGTLVADETEARIRAGAGDSRYPEAKLKKVLPTEEDRGILAARLAAAGIGFEKAVGAVARRPGGLGENGGELRILCGELEVAWDRLVATANQEILAADRIVERIKTWKRPLAPLLVGGGVLLSLATWIGLVLGGYLSAPGWFRPFAEWVWRW